MLTVFSPPLWPSVCLLGQKCPFRSLVHLSLHIVFVVTELHQLFVCAGDKFFGYQKDIITFCKYFFPSLMVVFFMVSFLCKLFEG